MCSLKDVKIKLKLQDLKLHRFGYKRNIMLLHPLSDSPAIVKYRVSFIGLTGDVLITVALINVNCTICFDSLQVEL